MHAPSRLFSSVLAGAALAASLFVIGPSALAQNGGGADRGPADHWVGTWATAVVARPPILIGPPAQGPQGFGPPPQALAPQGQPEGAPTSVIPVGAPLSTTLRPEPPVENAPAAQAGGRGGRGGAPPGYFTNQTRELTVPAFADLAIDLYLPGDTAASTVTTHLGAQQTSYVSPAGDHTGATDMPVMTMNQSWFFLSCVEVAASVHH
jgi:hypothetical protein